MSWVLRVTVVLAMPSWVGVFDQSGQSWGTSQGSMTALRWIGKTQGQRQCRSSHQELKQNGLGAGPDNDALMKSLKFIQGTETGKMQHMTTEAIQEKIGPWTSGWQDQRQRWEIGTVSAQSRQGLPWAGVGESPRCSCSGPLGPMGSHRTLRFPKENFLNGPSHHSQ